MKIAVYSSLSAEACQQTVRLLLEAAHSMGISVTCEKQIHTWLQDDKLSCFSDNSDLDKNTDLFFSIGGDGTLLRSLQYVQDSGIPVIGVNTGRLGFFGHAPSR